MTDFLLALLFVVLFTLKVTGAVALSWWVVCAPLLVWCAILFVALCLVSYAAAVFGKALQ